MRLGECKELISVEDLFENDDVVLMKAIYKKNSFHICELSAGLKNDVGDIEKIISLRERYL